MEGTAAANSKLQIPTHNTCNSSQRCRMPLWEAPESWLRLLVNRDDLIIFLPEIMSANWAMCEVVLRCMDRRRLVMKVRACHATTVRRYAYTCAPHASDSVSADPLPKLLK
jgi:hypothetical protein